MKVILAPTDFSEASRNAINFAAEIAKLSHAKLVLFHAFHIPVASTEVPVVLIPIDALEEGYMEDLLKIKKELHRKYGNSLMIDCKCVCGFAVDEINFFAKTHNTDLIVMGMQGAGFLAEKLIGSITSTLLRKADCPVLAIDRTVKFKAPKKIVLASDYIETENKSILNPLKEIANLFKSHVFVLNVIGKEVPVPAIPDAVSDYISLEDSLEDVEHSFHYIRDENVVHGISDFVTERKMDMVVMIPRKHSLLDRIFEEPTTKRMAFHASVPLLALHN